MGRGAYGSPELGIYRGQAGVDYPVRVEFIVPGGSGRLWAIPLVGMVLKLLVLLPHIAALLLIGVLVAATQLFLWIPVFFVGRYPVWAHRFVGGYLRWNVRVQAFAFGLTDQYPPFALSR